MSDVHELSPGEYAAFAEIAGNAYPVLNLNSTEERQRYRERLQQDIEASSIAHLYGCFRDDTLVGGMKLFDWTVNLHGSLQPAGGVGMVAVDLLHKRKHVAKELLEYFIRHYHERGAAWTMLYPFRPDFYRRMGFGYGAKLNMYRIKPASFPRIDGASDVVALSAADSEAVAVCYGRYAERTHGMITRSQSQIEGMLDGKNRAVGVRHNGAITGYLVFGFQPSQPDNFLVNDLVIHELIYVDTTALRQLLGWLNRQSDQFGDAIFNSHDDYLHHLLFDPRNGSENLVLLHHESNAQGLGLMYRVVDLPAAFRAWAGRDFGGQSARVRFNVADSFYPLNHGSTLVEFDAGRATVIEHGRADVELALEVGDLSSLLVGAVPFGALYEYGLAEVSQPSYIALLKRLFEAPKPVCMTRF